MILTNDIYQMGETLMPDGRRRGGFARLAAVVKAERAKGGHVLFAHGGDTLSPSLMSGIDQGAHIIALTNMIRPDIFVPGNHEFDFGKAVFLQRMAEAKFPLFAANLRGADGKPLRRASRTAIIVTLRRRASRGHRRSLRRTRRACRTPKIVKFLPTVATMKQQAEALRRDGRRSRAWPSCMPTASKALISPRPTPPIVILTGHNHDLFINFDGRTLLVELSYDAQYVTVIDLHHRDQAAGQPARSRTGGRNSASSTPRL